MAEGVGFEPTVRNAYNGFRDRPVRPLRHPLRTGERVSRAVLAPEHADRPQRSQGRPRPRRAASSPVDPAWSNARPARHETAPARNDHRGEPPMTAQHR